MLSLNQASQIKELKKQKCIAHDKFLFLFPIIPKQSTSPNAHQTTVLTHFPPINVPKQELSEMHGA